MRPIKAVIFDIDDTIFDMKTKTFIPSSIDAIKKLQKNNIVVIFATGRPPKTATVIVEEGIRPNYIVCTNGSLILNSDFEIINSRTFSEELCEEIYQYCLKEDIGLIFKFPDKVYEYIHKDVFENFYNKTKDSRKNVVFGNVEAHHKNNPNGGCLGADINKTRLFNEHFTNKCKAVRIDDLSSDLLLNGVSKKTGVEIVLNMLKILPEECMSFGDNDNDIEINDFVGIGVAVGNCSDNLREHADYVTDSIYEQGVYKALAKYDLI